MFLTVHATAGIAVASGITNPLFAFILGFISHFFVDMIPHGDEHIADWTTRLTKRERIAIIAGIDLGIASLFIYGVLWDIIVVDPLSLILGAFGGVLPDIIQGRLIINGNQPTDWFSKFHRFCHTLLQKEIPFRYGIIVQILFLSLLVYPLIT